MYLFTCRGTPPLVFCLLCAFFFFLRFIYLLVCLFIYLWLRRVFVAGRWAFSSCGERGLLFLVVRRLLIAVASLVVEHRL